MIKTDYYAKLAYMMSKARTDAKLSQKEMAVKMNVCANTIKNWEGLATVPDAVQVIMWFEALQLNIVEYFLIAFVCSNPVDEILKTTVQQLSAEHKQALYELHKIYGLDTLIVLLKIEIEVLNEK